MIDVPDIPSLRAKEARRGRRQPDREFLTGLQAATKDYVARLFERQAMDTERVKAETAALAEPQFRKAIGRSQPLVALADSAARELELQGQDRGRAAQTGRDRVRQCPRRPRIADEAGLKRV